MKVLAGSLIITFFNFCGLFLHAQKIDYNNVRFKNYDVTNGLSNNTVGDIFQDKYGFIWLATEDGLNRFDGYDFEVFNHDPKDSTTIGGNFFDGSLHARFINKKEEFIVDVENADFSYYVYNFKKEFRPLMHDIENLQYKQLKITPTITALKDLMFVLDSVNEILFIVSHRETPSKIVSTIYPVEEIKKNNWYFTYTKFLFKLNLNARHIELVNRFDKDLLSDLLCDLPEIMLFTNYEIFYFNLESKNEETLFTFDSTNSNGYVIDKQDRLWIVKHASGGVSDFFLYKNDSIIKIRHNVTRRLGLNDVTKVDNENWISTRMNGVLVVNHSNEMMHQFLPDKNDEYSIAGDGTRRIFIDSHNNVWIPTEQNGFSFYARSKSIIKNLNAHALSNPAINGEFVRGLTYDPKRNIIWIGTRDGGLTAYNLTTQTTAFYLENFKGGLHPESILPMSDTSVLLGSSWKGKLTGIYLYDFKNDELQKVFKKKEIEKNWYVRDLIKDKNGHIWAATMGTGLFKLSVNGEKSQMLLSDSTGDFEHNYIFRLIQNSDGDFVAGTESGIVVFDDKLHIKCRYTMEETPGKKLSNGTVFCIYEDPGQILWAGTFGGGLNRIDRQTEAIKLYNTNDGLCNNVIYGILPDEHGNLWLSTNNGLSCFNPENETFRNFSTKDGLIYDAFSFGAYCKDGDGNMYFGTQKGISVFHPDSLLKVTPVNHLVIRKLKIHGSNRSYNFPDSTETIQIDYLTENLFTLDYVCPEFVDQDKIEYSYRIDGLHKDWINLGNQRKLVLSTLPFGNHTINLKATKVPDIWNSSYTSIQVLIKPPFWETWYFRVFVLIAIFLTFWLILLNRRRNAKRVESIRTKLAHDLHDEIGSNISGISLIGRKLSWEEIDKKQAQKFSDDIVNMSQRTADSMRDIIWFMKPENDSPEKIKTRLIDFILTVLGDKDLKLEIDSDFFKKDISPEIQRNVYLMVKEMVNNIVKHAEAKSVLMRIQRNANFVSIRVKDDGKGMLNSKSGTGMSSLKKRTTQIKGQITINSSPGKGTEISIEAKL